MALTKVSRGLLTTSIVDNGNATAITIDSNENVGIGTGSPATTLHIQSASEPAITLFHTGIMASQIGLDSLGSLTFGIDGSTGATELMRITSAGNLGIGTNNPASLLDVSSTGAVISTVRSTSTSGARQATLRLNVASTGGDDPAGRVQFTYGTGYTVAGSIEMTHTNPAMKFLTGTTEVMRISGSNVGIGTQSPDTTLHLQTPSGTKSEINFAQTAVTNYRIGVPASTDALVFTYGASTERIRLNSAGNVGINNPNPAQILSICNPANPNRNGMEIAIGAGDTSSNTIQNYNRATGVYTPLNIVGSILTFGAGTSAIERMRLTALGSLKVKGPESAYISTSEYHEFSVNVASVAMYVYNSNASAGSAGILINVNNEASDANGYFLRGYSNSATRDNFYVYSNGNVVNRNNSFGTLSDQKLKQDIVDANNQWEDFKAIKFRKFRFKDDVIADPNTPYQLGVVAQELEAAGLNGLVSESPDKEFYQETVTDDDGNDVLDEDGNAVTEQKERLTGETTKSVKMSILYAKGMVALQEAMERIETLEAKVQTLENN